MAAKHSKAEKFFYEHAGYSYPSGATKAEQDKQRWLNARALADAEMRAVELGWRFTWEEDPEGYDPGDWPEDDVPEEVLTCYLRDEDGEVLESLGGNGMTGKLVQDQRFGRVVEAELALQALDRMRK